MHWWEKLCKGVRGFGLSRDQENRPADASLFSWLGIVDVFQEEFTLNQLLQIS